MLRYDSRAVWWPLGSSGRTMRSNAGCTIEKGSQLVDVFNQFAIRMNRQSEYEAFSNRYSTDGVRVRYPQHAFNTAFHPLPPHTHTFFKPSTFNFFIWMFVQQKCESGAEPHRVIRRSIGD